jgi:hypothetical protein
MRVIYTSRVSSRPEQQCSQTLSVLLAAAVIVRLKACYCSEQRCSSVSSGDTGSTAVNTAYHLLLLALLLCRDSLLCHSSYKLRLSQ